MDIELRTASHEVRSLRFADGKMDAKHQRLYSDNSRRLPSNGVVAKWLMRLTRNQFPSGA